MSARRRRRAAVHGQGGVHFAHVNRRMSADGHGAVVNIASGEGGRRKDRDSRLSAVAGLTSVPVTPVLSGR